MLSHTAWEKKEAANEPPMVGAEWGINQDGGGSSAMWLDGEIVNKPSDGEERPVGNGLVMMVLNPVVRSDTFSTGEPVKTVSQANIRVGPGDNHAAFTSLDEAELGLVLPHINGLNGVEVRGENWWRVAFDNRWGWVSERDLESDADQTPARLSVFGALLRPDDETDVQREDSQE